MESSIFIRSYAKDFTWLSYCVRSIRKYCRGFREVVLAIPASDKYFLPKDVVDNVDRLVLVREKAGGYIAQQITKMKAHFYCESPNIMYVDSDCIFFDSCEPSNFFKDGKPILLKTSYDVFLQYQNQTGKPQNVLRWKEITEKALGFTVTHEYMRRIPIIFKRETLETLHTEYPGIITYCEAITDNSLSEFNILGAIAEKYHPEIYSIQDTETEPLPKKFAEQYWSWGGISPELKEHLECVC